MLALAAPADCGAKVTPKVKLCPAARVIGRVKPLIVKAPLPVKLACDTVTLAPPELLNVAVCMLVLPTWTLPKLTELAASIPGVTPVPDSGMAKVGVGPLLVIARFTLLFPADCGANDTLNEAVCPALRVKGKVRPDTLYPEPAAT